MELPAVSEFWTPFHHRHVGGGPGPLFSVAAERHEGPQPDPWRPAVSILVAQISLKQLASTLPGEQGATLVASMEQRIADDIDFICGNGRPGHWPWPSPGPWFYQIVSELNVVANSLQEGALRNEVAKVAGQLLRQGIGANVAVARGKEGKKVAA